jgi:membrane-bound metal-dependent hydrolase YbcI (DUF457 family)
MRGWTHFFSGLAVVTFFPQLLSDLVNGVMWPVLAGIAAYMPDFVDFKFRKFLWRVDVVVDPAPRDPKTKLSPRRVKIGKLSEAEKWKFYYIEGYVERVLEERDDYAEFELRDETGKILVIARNGDYEKLRRALGSRLENIARSRRRITVPGYLEVEESGKLYWNVADAPHPQYIANAVAEAIDRAYESGRMVTIKIHNIRMPGDYYRRFLVHYDVENQRIVVYMGPLVSTGGLPLEGTEPPEYRKVGVAKTRHPFRKVYPRPTVIDAFSGPEIGYVRAGDVVEEVFIPWHRGFSHSVTASLLAGLVVGLIAFIAGYVNYLYLALACTLGYLAHVLEDQLGFMGSNLLPPLTKKRVPGAMLFPSRPGLMNFMTNWLMISLMIWNLNRYAVQLEITPDKPVKLSTLIQTIPPHLEDYALLGILVAPTILVYLAGLVDRWLFIRKYRAPGVEEAKRKETVEEVLEEVGGY